MERLRSHSGAQPRTAHARSWRRNHSPRPAQNTLRGQARQHTKHRPSQRGAVQPTGTTNVSEGVHQPQGTLGRTLHPQAASAHTQRSRMHSAPTGPPCHRVRDEWNDRTRARQAAHAIEHRCDFIGGWSVWPLRWQRGCCIWSGGCCCLPGDISITQRRHMPSVVLTTTLRCLSTPLRVATTVRGVRVGGWGVTRLRAAATSCVRPNAVPACAGVGTRHALFSGVHLESHRGTAGVRGVGGDHRALGLLGQVRNARGLHEPPWHCTGARGKDQ